MSGVLVGEAVGITVGLMIVFGEISGEKTLSQGDNQTAYVFRHLMGFLILAAIAGVLTAVGTVVQGQVRPGILLRLVTLLMLDALAIVSNVPLPDAVTLP